MKDFKNKRRGFLLVEALLSMFVLVTGLTTVLALISSSLKNSFESRDTIIAVELAQEGVELVLNVRDNGFSLPFSAFSTANKHCRIDYTAGSFGCTSGLQSRNYYSLQYSGGFFKHIGTAEKFYRYIYVNYNGSDTATVKSFVFWGASPNFGSSGNESVCTVLQKCVFTEITLTNWR